MSKQHAFEQETITGIGGNWFSKESKWNKFKGVCFELGYEVRVTGGNFLTHEINASREDFDVILDLMKH
ncbi:MAG TPA: hypothetical protein EYN54_14425 [Methylococcaceae bacterium]|nr:hypothetical protein [Methylococcaceae bacterium]